MGGKDIIGMSLRELKRLKVVQEAIDGHITQNEAALMLGVSERQVRRVVRAVKEEGDRGVIYGNWRTDRSRNEALQRENAASG